MLGMGHVSDIQGGFRCGLTLPTGPCSACPPTGEHLYECLLDDKDKHLDLDPIWHR